MITKIMALSSDKEEQVPFVSPQFLYHAGCDEISKYPGKCVAWHWHTAVEFSWVLQGRLKVQTNHHEEILEEGEGCFINSNFLHSYAAMPGKECIYFCQVFDPSVVAGLQESIFSQKYVLPVTRCGNLELSVLKSTTALQRKELELLREAQETAELKEMGYELHLRNLLSDIWLNLYRDNLELIQSMHSGTDIRELRVKAMLSYIQENFSEKIALDEIADAAGVSRRECLRCFKDTIGKSPFEYLQEYRVHQACGYLNDRNKSITEIGLLCGFSSPSYFIKKFGEIMHCTPKEFRRSVSDKMK